MPSKITAQVGDKQITIETGKLAKQLDTQLDDSNTLTGSFRVAAIATPGTALANASVDDGTAYLVCLAF